MSADVQSRPGGTVDAERRRLARWRQEFNHVRPHDALGGKVPADIYKVIARRRPVAVPYVYSAHMHVRTVSSEGAVCLRDKFYVGEAFAGLEIGLEPVSALHVRAWYRDVDLGLIEVLPDVDISCFDRAAGRQTRRRSAA